MKRVAILLLLAISPLACKENKTESVASTPASATENQTLSPEELGTLGAQIKNNPSESARLLSEKGLDEKSFAEAIRRVTEDRDASLKYTEAFKKEAATGN